MTDPELVRRAEAAGISPVYRNSREELVSVSDETLTAILRVLEAPAGPGWRRGQGRGSAGPAAPRRGAGDGWARPAAQETTAEGRAGAGAEPVGGRGSRPVFPERRAWGFTVQLYSVRSRRSWGHGDLGDLAELASWSATDLGAGFVLVNPLHAAEPLPPVSPSPYLPMTRRYISPLYLRVEDIPEYAQLTEAQRARVERLAAPLRARNTAADHIDRDAVWTAKRAALELIHAIPRSAERQAGLDGFLAREGAALQDWASWCALAERHGPDWRHWPAEIADPGRAAALTACGVLAERAEFHAWLQWLADEQLAAAQDAALAAGMDIGLVADLAVGVHPGGADAWSLQDLLVQEMSVGAPPDDFNQLGQDWAQPPWHPRRLAAEGYRPLAELLRAALRHAGGVRVDHVMGLMRLWWIPEGMPPDRGAYVNYDHAATVAALTREAAEAGAVAIGEDLGTVDRWIRRYLADHGILGTTLLWFAAEPDGSPLRPQHWRRGCMATVGSHDLPPVAGFVTGEQVAVRARLGLLKEGEDAERKAAGQMLTQWHEALVREGLLAPGPRPPVADFTVALYGYLARTPAVLIGISLADAVGDVRAQNIPGTSDQYPNWQIPLCDADGRPVLLEELPRIDLLRAVARAVAGRAGRDGDIG